MKPMYDQVLESILENIKSLPSPMTVSDLKSLCMREGVIGHLAILNEPYLTKILRREKTIESRFTKNRIAPYGILKPGMLIFLKESSGPIKGVAIISKAEYFGPLANGEAEELLSKYSKQLCVETAFVEQKKNARYASLIYIEKVSELPNYRLDKADRRTWVVLANEPKQTTSLRQLTFLDTSKCAHGVHAFHNSKLKNAKGYPLCKYCGSDIIDWERLHKRSIADFEFTLSQLTTDEFRLEWWSTTIDEVAYRHAIRKGLAGLIDMAHKRITNSVGKVYKMPNGKFAPYRDGFQTPFKGNIIYYAQHAIGCCCRKCIEYWHGIPQGRELSASQIEYFVALIEKYIKLRLNME